LHFFFPTKNMTNLTKSFEKSFLTNEFICQDSENCQDFFWDCQVIFDSKKIDIYCYSIHDCISLQTNRNMDNSEIKKWFWKKKLKKMFLWDIWSLSCLTTKKHDITQVRIKMSKMHFFEKKMFVQASLHISTTLPKESFFENIHFTELEWNKKNIIKIKKKTK
jgi:hypothetical protein